MECIMFVILADGYDTTPRDEYPKLSFDLSDWECPRAERPCFVTVSAWDAYGNQVEVTVNRSGEGLFERWADGTWHQIAGTLQYGLPRSHDGIVHMLTRMWRQHYTMDYYMYMAWLDIEALEAEEYYAD